MLKVNSNVRYASDAQSSAALVLACEQAGVPLQRYAHRSDLPCGSTIGPITAAAMGIPTVDVGAPQLAMHSCRELCGADDPPRYAAAMAAFLAPAPRSWRSRRRAPSWVSDPRPRGPRCAIAYRAQIAASHPDRAGGDPARAAVVTEAYATLEQAHREGRLADRLGVRPRRLPRRRARRRAPAPLDEPPEVLDGDTVHLVAPPDEAFARLVEACHRIGDVTYIDRSCAILEALVPRRGRGRVQPGDHPAGPGHTAPTPSARSRRSSTSPPHRCGRSSSGSSTALRHPER